MENFESLQDVDWQEIQPDKKYVWLTEGFEDDFDSFIALGSKEAKASKVDVTDCIFKVFSNGVKTNRDDWIYNFRCEELLVNIQLMANTYNEQLIKWNHQNGQTRNIDDFVTNDNTKISWSRDLKNYFKRNITLEPNQEFIRESIYRPFVRSYIYFAPYFNDVLGKFPYIFPTEETERENQVICL